MIKKLVLSDEVLTALKSLCAVIDDKYYLLDGVIELSAGSNEVKFLDGEDLPEEVVTFLFKELIENGDIGFMPPGDNLHGSSYLHEA